MSTQTTNPIHHFPARAAQFERMDEHLGHARMLADMGLVGHAMAEVAMVQAQLKFLARTAQHAETLEAREVFARLGLAEEA